MPSPVHAGVLARANPQEAPQHHGPQPLADISFGLGRLASDFMGALTNEDKKLTKQRQKWKREQAELKAKEDAEKKEQAAAQQQQAEQQAAIDGSLDSVNAEAALAESAAAAAEGGAEFVADELAPEAVATAGERSIVSEYTGAWRAGSVSC